MLNTFTHVRIWLNLMVIEIYAKNYCLTLYSIFSNGGHVSQRIKNLHISSMLDTPRNIPSLVFIGPVVSEEKSSENDDDDDR